MESGGFPANSEWGEVVVKTGLRKLDARGYPVDHDG